ncbi:sulfotransferase 1C2-like [Antedon mediterranea]|uniref:sulfotransferase 1C2-like n=1 Tax=Antedon mediterranea TaxID=105859 RepID=UPI003AF4AF41
MAEKGELSNGCYEYKGIKFVRWLVSPDNLDAMETFEVRPDDIFLITYLKCGTHWAYEIINLILTGGDPDKIDHSRHEAVLEMMYMADKSNRTFGSWYLKLNSMKGRRIIITHLPLSLLPPQVFSKKVKIIYVARNPKDCGVSLYHVKKTIGTPDASSWEAFIGQWIEQKNLEYGGFFPHVLDFWKYRHEPYFLYMKFEDMKKDPRGAIIQFADHLECTLTEEELDRVVYNSDVKNMKKTYEKVEKNIPNGELLTKAMGKAPFIRKGQIGDWKNHYTVAQNEQFDAVIRENLHGTGLAFDFE